MFNLANFVIAVAKSSMGRRIQTGTLETRVP